MRRLSLSSLTLPTRGARSAQNGGASELDDILASANFNELFCGVPISCLLFDKDGRILHCNPSAEELYGWSREQLLGQALWETIALPEDRRLLQGQLDRLFAGESFRDQEWKRRCADGTMREVRCCSFPVRDEDGQIRAVISTALNLSERKRDQERMVRHAFHDSLTGLPERKVFLERIEDALRRAQGHDDYDFAVLLLNLDRFKITNESLGHALGDQILLSTTRKLEACIAKNDMLARLSGDEFAILLDGVESEEAVIGIAERIQKRLALPSTVKDQELYITASIGIAPYRINHRSADDLLRDAHTALDRAKTSGKARYEFFEKGIPARARTYLQLEADLRRAQGRSQLRMEYQPIISLSTGVIDGFEALVRWYHPQKGIISPGQFIPLAEETGLIIPIGYWALRESCNQLAYWQTTKRPRSLPITMSVNISPRQFAQPNLLEQIVNIIKRSGVDPGFLKLEITESALMNNTEAAVDMMTQIKAMGVKMSLDDFGTGYSSLSYLHRFPFNILKIDQSFVTKMDRSNSHEEIVRAIIALGHSLNMDVIAEGVEGAAQLAQLRMLKCHYGQGYYFSASMDPTSAQELLRANPQW